MILRPGRPPVSSPVTKARFHVMTAPGPALPALSAAAILLPMKHQSVLPAAVSAPPPPLRTIAASVLLWSAISVLGALQTYSDNLRSGVASHYPALLVTWFIEYAVPLIVLSAGLSTLLSRWPALLARPRNVVLLFVGLVV